MSVDYTLRREGRKTSKKIDIQGERLGLTVCCKWKKNTATKLKHSEALQETRQPIRKRNIKDRPFLYWPNTYDLMFLFFFLFVLVCYFSEFPRNKRLFTFSFVDLRGHAYLFTIG